MVTIFREIIDTLCLNGCSGNGDCNNGTCVCKKGHMDVDCSLSKISINLDYYEIGSNTLKIIAPSESFMFFSINQWHTKSEYPL